MKYYIIWEESGVKKKKTYSSKPGVSYWKKKIVGLLGENAILEEGEEKTEVETVEKPKKEAKKSTGFNKVASVSSETKKSTENSKKNKDFNQSNWNPVKNEYTSRMYNSFNDTVRVIEPDDTISLQGNDIIKKHDKERGIYTLTDGRKFTVSGWPA